MGKIRVTYQTDPELNYQCGNIHIDSYTLDEVMLPSNKREKARKAIHIVIRGKNFRAAAQPLMAFVGKVPVQFLRIAPDECTIEGILPEEPENNSPVDVILGDQDHARHPEPFKRAMIKPMR